MSKAAPEDELKPIAHASKIQLHADEGKVFGPLSFEIPDTGLTSIHGRSGSGRTALSLCLAGRMKLTSGTLTVAGSTKRNVFAKNVAIAGIDKIDGLDRDIRIRVVLSEHLAWSRPWFAWTPSADQETYEKLCSDVFAGRSLPPLDAYVAELSNLDRILLRISLALHPADGSHISLLVMDDLEQVRETEDRQILLQILARISKSIPVIVTTVNPLEAEFPAKHTELELFTDHHHLRPQRTGAQKTETEEQ